MEKCKSCGKEIVKEQIRTVAITNEKDKIEEKHIFCSVVCIFDWLSIEDINKMWGKANFPLRHLSKKELETPSITIPMGKIDTRVCYKCSKIHIDCCSRCEKPLCKEHCLLLVISQFPEGQPMFVLGYCENCTCLWELLVGSIIRKHEKEKVKQ